MDGKMNPDLIKVMQRAVALKAAAYGFAFSVQDYWQGFWGIKTIFDGMLPGDIDFFSRKRQK